MRLSLEWLRDYIEIGITPEELAERMTMAGITVENIEVLPKDTILHLDLTPNRGDCLGIINVAREVAALTGSPLEMPGGLPVENQDNIEDYIRVTIESPLCRRYAARIVNNVRVAPSPVWLQERLENAGIRAINNVVDVTNYVMLETNQPMHAFDYDLLEGKRIVARNARPGEVLVTLDGNERQLDPSMLVIADAVKPVALAGMMGGESSEIGDNTVTILLESANFDGINIRRTARKMAMRTESSMRFEKGVDVEGAVNAVNRAARLLEILGAGEVVQGIDDVYPEPKDPTVIRLRPARVNYLLGTEIDRSEMLTIFERLSFPIKKEGDNYLVTAPSYRPDVTEEVDLIEEVARLFGYDKISSAPLPKQLTNGFRTEFQKFKAGLLDHAVARLRQIVTYSFINPRWLDILQVPEDDVLRQVVKVANPFSEEQGIMRTTMLPGLLDVAGRNISRRNEDLALVEMGSVFLPREGAAQPDEVLTLAGLVSGKVPGGWQGGAQTMDFYFLKGLLEVLLKTLHLPSVEFAPLVPRHSYHPGRTAAIIVGGKQIGVMGEVHPAVLERLDIEQRVCAFELDVEDLFRATVPHDHTQGVPKYPAIKRDLALVVDEQVAAADLSRIIWSAGGELLIGVDLFDVYRSEGIGKENKSLAFALTFQSYHGTLQDEVIVKLMDDIVLRTQEVYGARLR